MVLTAVKDLCKWGLAGHLFVRTGFEQTNIELFTHLFKHSSFVPILERFGKCFSMFQGPSIYRFLVLKMSQGTPVFDPEAYMLMKKEGIRGVEETFEITFM